MPKGFWTRIINPVIGGKLFMSSVPNLFVIGAMKSGTSSLCNYIGTHPQIYMAKLKEPMHFSREENWSNGNADYLSLFSEVTDEAYLGEGSTEYTKLPFRKGVVDRLYDFNPQAKLIYIMRDPFERIVSQYKHMLKKEGETRHLQEVIKTPSDYLTNSYYAYQLRPYIEKFGPDALFVDTFENLVACPEKICSKIFQWLGLEDTFVPPNLKTVYHVSPKGIQVINGSTLIGKIVSCSSCLPKRYNISRAIPKELKAWLKSKVVRKVDFDCSSSDFQNDVSITRAAVGPVLSDWVKELEQLTGCIYNSWPIVENPTRETESSLGLAEEIRKNIDQIWADNRTVGGKEQDSVSSWNPIFCNNTESI